MTFSLSSVSKIRGMEEGVGSVAAVWHSPGDVDGEAGGVIESRSVQTAKVI
jgi:hypothetical protein